MAAPAIPPVRLNASVLSNGDVRLVWTTTPGRTSVLQRSADLADWQDLITLNAVGDSLEHIDAATPGAAMRFFVSCSADFRTAVQPKETKEAKNPTALGRSGCSRTG